MTVDEKINALIDIVQVLTYHTKLNGTDACNRVIFELQKLKDVEVTHD